MNFLLRMLLIGLTPLAMGALGLVLSVSWLVLTGLCILGVILSTWMYLHWVIRPIDLLHSASKSFTHRQSLLQAVLDNAPMQIAIKDRESRYLLANTEFTQQYGVTEAQILGKTDIELAPEDAARQFRESDLTVLQSGKKLISRAYLQIQNQWRQMETVKFPLFDEGNKVIGVGLLSSDITEMAASLKKFAQVFHASPNWIVVTRLDDGVIVDANESFERISGYSISEIVGLSPADLNVWAVPEQRVPIMEELLREGKVRDSLVQMRRKDGEVRDCLTSATLIALEDQGNSHPVWIVRDVTEEYAINAQFSTAFRLSPDFMAISVADDGRYVEVNEAFERFTGYTRNEVIGRTALELGVWNVPTQRLAMLELIRETGSVTDFLIQIRHTDGRIRDAMVNAAIFESCGEHYLVSLAHDVTKARLAEKAMRESEARFASLFESSPLPTAYTVDSDGHSEKYRNEAFYKTFGYPREPGSEKSAIELNFWVNPEDGERARQLRRDAKAISNWVVEVRCADGSHRWVSLFGRIIIESNRKIMVTTMFDITDERRAQHEIESLNARLEDRVTERTQQLQNANEELSLTLQTLKQAKDHLVQSEKLAALGALVAGIAHELNTPIGNGLMAASSLEDKTKEFIAATKGGLTRSSLSQFAADAQFASDILVRNLTRAGSLVASFKQVAVDRTSSQRRKFDLHTLLEEILITLNPLIRESGCQLILHIDPGLKLDSYPGSLGQVLINLINNAMIHGFDEGHTETIVIAASAIDSAGLQLSVKDSGRGIAEKNLNRIFDPFFATRLGEGGSGLGLHIVHNIVTGVLGGKIEVVSAPGAGTEFILYLPMAAPATI